MPNAFPTSPAHSEVPWRTKDIGDESPVIVISSPDGDIATLHYPSEEECELLDEEEADRLVERRNTDARLMTAAPVLLDKVEQACQNMQDIRSGIWEPSDEEFNEVLYDFHAVLTAVTGVNRRNETQEEYLARQFE